MRNAKPEPLAVAYGLTANRCRLGNGVRAIEIAGCSHVERWGRVLRSGYKSSLDAGPTASCRRFRFVFMAGHTRAIRDRRRVAVAEPLGNWVPMRIMAEQAVGKRCYLWFEVARAVTAAAVKDYVQDCPASVAGTFKALG